MALLRFKERLPRNIIVEYETTIREYYSSSRNNNTAINSPFNNASPPTSAEVTTATALATPIDTATTTTIDSEEQQRCGILPTSGVAETYYGNDGNRQPEQPQEQQQQAEPHLELTKELLQATTEIETTIPNPYYIPGPQLVVDSLLTIGNDQNTTTTTTTTTSRHGCNDDSSDNNINENCIFDDVKIEQFIKDWRMHFVETMAPRYLPNGWSVENRVHCD